MCNTILSCLSTFQLRRFKSRNGNLLWNLHRARKLLKLLNTSCLIKQRRAILGVTFHLFFNFVTTYLTDKFCRVSKYILRFCHFTMYEGSIYRRDKKIKRFLSEKCQNYVIKYGHWPCYNFRFILQQIDFFMAFSLSWKKNLRLLHQLIKIDINSSSKSCWLVFCKAWRNFIN